MNQIERLHEVLIVLTAAASIKSIDLKDELCRAAGKALRAVADDVDPRLEALPEAPLDQEDTSSTASKGSSKYHDFISELSPHVRRALPNSPQTERFKLIASLWSKYKAYGYQEAVFAAKRDLPIEQVAVFGIDLDADKCQS
jgi:hypothetical protein